MSLSSALITEAVFKLIRTKLFLYVAAGTLVFGLYKWNEWTIENLRQENEQLKQDKVLLESSLEEISKNHDKIRKSLDVALAEKQKSLIQLEETKRSLYREIRKRKSLEELAVAKPKLVERRINDASEHVNKCFENLSKGLPCEK